MPIRFRQATLPNGLTAIAEIDPAAHTAAAGFYVRTGARDEDPAVMGVSHFLEHMIFKGTATRSAADVDRDFDDIGAEHNAFTTSEMTAFWAHALPEHLPDAIGILADILRPALRPQDFDDEKPVILEEIAMYADQPFWVLYERAMEVYFGKHPLSHRVLGTRGTIEALTRDQMQAYFQHRYAADNTTVAMAGRLDFDSVVAQLEKLCGDWRTTRPDRAHPALAGGGRDFTLESDTVNRRYAVSLAPAPPIQDERRYTAAMLSLILGDADGSRLYWSLVETGLAEEARASYEGHDGIGTYLVYYTCSPEHAVEVDRVVSEQIEALPGTVSDDDLQRVKSKIATGATLQGELPGGRMHRLGRLWTSMREYRPLEEELRRIDAVTLDDVRGVFEAFPFRPRVTGYMTPASGGA